MEVAENAFAEGNGKFQLALLKTKLDRCVLKKKKNFKKILKL